MPLALLQWVADPILINNLIIPLAGMATAVILGLPVVKALVRFLERKTGGTTDGDVQRELETLRSRLEQMEVHGGRVFYETLEEIRGRMLDLEERVDFAERMLAKSRERPQIAPEG